MDSLIEQLCSLTITHKWDISGQGLKSFKMLRVTEENVVVVQNIGLMSLWLDMYIDSIQLQYIA